MSTESELDESTDKSFSKFFEATVKSILSFLVQYFRTFGLLFIQPHRVASKLIRVQPNILRYVPPLTFLTVSTLLFAIDAEFTHINIFGGATGPQGLFRVVGERLRGDISITRVLLSALPVICFVVLASYLLSRLLMRTDRTRTEIAELVVYIISFQATGHFLDLVFYCLLSVVSSGSLESGVAPPVFGPRNPLVDAVALPRSLYSGYVSLYPLMVVPFSIHMLESIKSKKIKFLKMLIIVIACLLIMGGMTLLASLPQQLSKIAMPPGELARLEVYFVNDDDSVDRNRDHYKIRVTSDEKGVNLVMNVVIKNPSSETFIFGRDMGSLDWRTDDIPAGREVSGQLPLKAEAWSDGDIPTLVLKPGEAKWIRLSAKSDCSTYYKLQALAGC